MKWQRKEGEGKIDEKIRKETEKGRPGREET